MRDNNKDRADREAMAVVVEVVVVVVSVVMVVVEAVVEGMLLTTNLVDRTSWCHGDWDVPPSPRVMEKHSAEPIR